MTHANHISLVRKWDIISGFSISCNGKEGIVAVKYEERVLIYNRDWLAGIYAWMRAPYQSVLENNLENI